MNPELIPHLLFPVGHLTKPEVRKIAEEKNLVVAKKKDSQGICFVGNKGYANFVEEHVPKEKLLKGKIIRYPTNEVMGEHEGIHHYTYGQSKGLGLTYHEKLFVLKIDAETHTVWVGDEKYLFHDELTVEDVNHLGPITDGETLRVKIRYQHKGALAKVFKIDGGGYRICFEEPQRAITPGQAAVFYREKALIGGGWIRP